MVSTKFLLVDSAYPTGAFKLISSDIGMFVLKPLQCNGKWADWSLKILKIHPSTNIFVVNVPILRCSCLENPRKISLTPRQQTPHRGAPDLVPRVTGGGRRGRGVARAQHQRVGLGQGRGRGGLPPGAAPGGCIATCISCRSRISCISCRSRISCISGGFPHTSRRKR